MITLFLLVGLVVTDDIRLVRPKVQRESRSTVEGDEFGTREDRPQLRIFNGDDADTGEYPFMAYVRTRQEFGGEDGTTAYMCGGSILSDRVILTAAHCLVKDHSEEGKEIFDNETGEPLSVLILPINIGVHVGETGLQEWEEGERRLTVAALIVHEDYDSYSVENDIALIVTSETIPINRHVNPIGLPVETDIATLYAEGAPISVIGWGTTEEGQTTHKLQELHYSVTSDSACKMKYGGGILEGMFCSGEHPMEERSGLGDSGGPLFTKKDGSWVQLGLVSWGPEEHDAHSYDVNTDISYFKPWITSNMNMIFTDYITTVTADASARTLTSPTLPNYLYRTINIVPAAGYVRITVKAATLKSHDMVMIYDGSDTRQDMALQLDGTFPDTTLTSTTSNGLTVAVMTGKQGESDGFTFEYRAVSERGSYKELTCSAGYIPCSDRKYCILAELGCDGVGNCIDASDETDHGNCSNFEVPKRNEEKTDDSGTAKRCISVLALLALLAVY